LQAIYQAYGYDFRNYAYDSIRRRILHAMQVMGERTVSGFIPRILHDPRQLHLLLDLLIINVSEMFRDPSMFKEFRKRVIPFLRTYPHIRIWHAGCSRGEEVLSMAILLEEEGLYDKARIYATDIDEGALAFAREGQYPLSIMEKFAVNYRLAGGTRDFSEYYTVEHNEAKFRPTLLRNVVFASHNLVTDHSFNEFNVIMCRNVMIYFDRQLQNRVHQLFYDSLAMFGFLSLGSPETVSIFAGSDCYEAINEKEKLYRRIK
jgi:chemotaxis protein methyltransferase CheR